MSQDSRVINNPDIFRSEILLKLNYLINNETITSNLEKGIYNYTLQTCETKNLIKKWNNPYFVLIYLQKVKTILSNLKNETLLNKLKNKEIKAHELAFMTHQQMRPDIWDKLIEEKKIKDENKFCPKIEASTDELQCFKCKSRGEPKENYTKCTYYQLQTRSADEPMTTFVTCITCGSRWKF